MTFNNISIKAEQKLNLKIIEYKAEKFLYMEPKHAKINLEITKKKFFFVIKFIFINVLNFVFTELSKYCKEHFLKVEVVVSKIVGVRFLVCSFNKVLRKFYRVDNVLISKRSFLTRVFVKD